MSRHRTSTILSTLALLSFAGAVSAQTWNPEQQEIWKFEELQWKMAAAKDSSWIEKMVHPNLSYWETGEMSPAIKASLSRWDKYGQSNNTVIEQELFPIAITITGSTAVVQYRYKVARENTKKEREIVNGHYSDVLVKDDGHWRFLAWAGGDDPKSK